MHNRRDFWILFLIMAAMLLPLQAEVEKQPAQAAPAVSAAPDAPDAPRLHLGARLSADIPDLLRKHLQLEPNQGLLVENIFRSSPADKAGLDKDDILLTFDGIPLTDARAFYRSLRELTAPKTVSITLIHQGQRKEVSLTLEIVSPDFKGFRQSDESNWKYPIEPEESIVIRPGRMFQMRPGQQEWIEIPTEQLKQSDNALTNLGVLYNFLHNDGQTEFTVVIRGNPNEPTASVRVKTADKEYAASADKLDKLPAEYRRSVRLDIEKAKKTYERGRNVKVPAKIDPAQLQELFGEAAQPPRPKAPDNAARLDALAEQLRQMEERQKALETYLKEKLG